MHLRQFLAETEISHDAGRRDSRVSRASGWVFFSLVWTGQLGSDRARNGGATLF
jgi:hypothetical protein